jgi:hypothetical protein
MVPAIDWEAFFFFEQDRSNFIDRSDSCNSTVIFRPILNGRRLALAAFSKM